MSNRIVMVCMAICALANVLHAIPNYWDPNNIINSADRDPYWFFHLTPEVIAIARNHPAMRDEMLKEAEKKVQEYRPNVRGEKDQEDKAKAILEKSLQLLREDLKDPFEQEVDRAKQEVTQAQQRLKEAQEAVRTRRNGIPCRKPLSDENRADLKRFLNKKAEDVLVPKTKIPVRPMMEGSILPNVAAYQRRAEIEAQYEELRAKFYSYANCPRLSGADKRLVEHAREHLNKAYDKALELNRQLEIQSVVLDIPGERIQ